MTRRFVRIKHRESGALLAEGPLGWGITRFEGNYYVRSKYLKTDRLKINFVPGLCIYKFLYVWLDLCLPDYKRSRMLAWIYWLPNPLLPFIWFRVAFPGMHRELAIEEYVAKSPDNSNAGGGRLGRPRGGSNA